MHTEVRRRSKVWNSFEIYRDIDIDIDINIDIDIDIDLSSFFVCMFGFQIIPLDLEGMQISKPLGQRLGQESFGFS